MKKLKAGWLVFAVGAIVGWAQGCEPSGTPAAGPDTGSPVASALPGQAGSSGADTPATPTPQPAATTMPKSPRAQTAAVQTPVAPAGRAQSPVAPGGLAQTPIAPAGLEAKRQPAFSSNLLTNGSFEYIADDGRPGGWAVVPREIAAVDTESPVDGDNALALTSTDDVYGILACKIPVTSKDLGKNLEVSASAISDSHWGLTMNLEAEQNGEKTTLARTGWKEAPGEWVRVSLDAELPQDIDPESVSVQFVLQKEAGLTFKLDDVQATVAVLTNGSFEFVGDDGRPGGWAVAPIEAIRPAEMVKPYDGDNLLAIESTDERWIVVARDLYITPADLGRNITVAARARTPVNRGMFLSVQCEVNSETLDLGDTPWPASPDEWTQVQTTVKLPEDADPDSVQARIRIRNQGGQRYYIDDVQAQLQ